MTEPDRQRKDGLMELEAEGLTLKIPLVRDEGCGKSVLDYPDYLKQPYYTPDGWRVMLTYEDACPHADLQPGICHSPAMRRQENMV